MGLDDDLDNLRVPPARNAFRILNYALYFSLDYDTLGVPRATQNTTGNVPKGAY
jgi:hypothetical protein